MQQFTSLKLLLLSGADDNRQRFALETTPSLPQPVLLRYRDFERLAASLKLLGIRFALPGKLLIHSPANLEHRRQVLEAELAKVVLHKTLLPPPLVELLKLSGSSKDLVAVESATSSDSDSSKPHHASPTSSPESELWALAMFAQRARRRERHENLSLLRRTLLVLSGLYFVTALMSRRRRTDLLGSLLAATLAHFAPWPWDETSTLGFGMGPASALDSSDEADARGLQSWLQQQQQQPAPLPLTPSSPSPPLTEHPSVAVLDELNASKDFIKAWEHAQQVMQAAADDDDPELIWRVLRACYYSTKGLAGGAEALQQALNMSQRALMRRDDHYLVHKWHAIVSNAAGERGSTKDRILSAVAFEKHTKRALQLQPSDATLWYMMGRFAFDVAKLSWVERAAARAIFGSEPPRTSFGEALEAFERAMKIRPSAGVAVEIGRCHMALGDKAKARDVWSRVLAREYAVEQVEDFEALSMADALIKEGV